MAGSTRAELASSNLDGSSFPMTYPSGQRGSYSGASLDRSGSFRESLENRINGSGPCTSRNATPSLEIPPLSQYLTLEPLSLSDQKYSRSGELRRVLGVSVEEHSFGSAQSKPVPPIASEELKRFRASIQDQNIRARDRGKSFQESIVKLDRYRSLITRKRQRNEIPSVEKAGGSNSPKVGSRILQNSPDIVSQRLEERTRNVVPNRRIRSSMAEVRSEGSATVPLKHGMVADKDKNTLIEKEKNMLRACNGGQFPAEDKLRGLPAGGDGWDKKMKRKRSVGNMVASRIAEGDRELKPAAQQRPSGEPHQRLSDGVGFRPGSSNGIIESGRMDVCSQPSGPSSRAILRNDLEIGSLTNERRERSAGLDKERLITKGSNKLNTREDTQAGSKSPLTKGRASRAPRTGLGIGINTSSNVPRSIGGIDGWEQPSLNKVQPLSAAINRKRPLPTGSSSPPVAQWVGQRPQKISRTRRANVVSPVSNGDEAQSLSEGFAVPDIATRVATNESPGPLLSRGMPNNSQQLKLKVESVKSPAGFSESEESGAIDNKFMDREVDNVDMEDGFLNPGQKMANFVLPTKKSKVTSKEDLGDGVRRQGRSGRGSIQSKPSLPVKKGKIGNMDANKPPKCGRPGLDKGESRVGRPPSKKSDHKAFLRTGQASTGFVELTLGESDDDREELLEAANAAHNDSNVSCSGSFWKNVQSYFSVVIPEDMAYVKQQITFTDQLDDSLCNMLGAGHKEKGVEQQVSQTNLGGTKKSGGTACSFGDLWQVQMTPGNLHTEKWFEKIVPLSQRLLSAFVAEDGTDKFDCGFEEEDFLLQYSSSASPYGKISQIEAEHLMPGHSKYSFASNGSIASANIGSPGAHNLIINSELLRKNDDPVHLDNGLLSELNQPTSRHMETMGSSLTSSSPSECPYELMSLEERILMELHSIDLYPESVPDLSEGEDEEIDKDVSELKMRLYQKVGKKKRQLHVLEEAIKDVKETEERKLEQLAMHKLVEMAYKKLLGGRGGSSHKSGASKASKQLALAFAKRTLFRCQKFEETGQSCFREPAFQDVIFSSALHCSDGKSSNGISLGTSNIYGDVWNCPPGSRVSGFASRLTSATVERNGLGDRHDKGPRDSYQTSALISEQTSVKHDLVSGRGKKREVLLDDVVPTAASRATPTLSHALPGGAKGKRTERDRDQSKAGRSSISNGRPERRSKTKPKQKTAQLSSSGNGLLGRATEVTSAMLSSSRDSSERIKIGNIKQNQGTGLPSSGNRARDCSKENEDNAFSNLRLPAVDSIEELDVTDGIGGQNQDLTSWLEEAGLPDLDIMGLDIPMDDLSELKLGF